MAPKDSLHLRTAVIVNPRAKHFGGRLMQLLLAHVPPDALFLCEQKSALDALVPALLHSDFDIVACAGGDGTVAAVIERMGTAQPQRLLPLAVLPLGTGNALAHYSGKPTLAQTLKALMQLRRDRPLPTRPLALIEDHAHHRFFFGGAGIDSLLLADYNRVRRDAQNPVANYALQGALGYAYAVARHTLPALLKEPLPIIAHIRTRKPAYFLRRDAMDAMTPIAPGTTLWHGPLSLWAVGTAPTLGYGLRMFPFAERLGGLVPPMMQLRFSTLKPRAVVRYLPQIFRGQLRHPELYDFAVRDIDIELTAPFAWQTSGDERGVAQRFRLKVSPWVLSLVHLSGVAS